MQDKTEKEKKIKITWKSFTNSSFLLALFLGIGIWRYLATGGVFYMFIFGYIGFSLFIGEFLSASLVRKYKPWGRRTTQLLVGLFMLGFLGFLAHENMQIEGFFFYLYAGVFAGATLHYFIAKLAGPMFFGRGWCGWACWTMMVLDFFPWKIPAQGRIRKLGLLRYIHFAFILGMISVLIFYLDYGPKQHHQAELTWLIVGNLFYYVSAIILAAVLKDNRAFCKYLCPIIVTQKITSGLSLFKQQIDMDSCDECEICEDNCPMDIKLLDYSRNDQRILSSECILCNTCVNSCPTGSISTTKKFDIGWKESLNMKS
ncbi:MAG: 4Fe-4S binding protein [candidate division Zixibacteria bacterium]|nr:4Fe-4S binding protein [candidate division Zixibacteria bacterium]